MKNPFIKKENRIIWNVVTDILYRIFTVPFKWYFSLFKSFHEGIKSDNEGENVAAFVDLTFIFTPILAIICRCNNICALNIIDPSNAGILFEISNFFATCLCSMLVLLLFNIGLCLLWLIIKGVISSYINTLKEKYGNDLAN